MWAAQYHPGGPGAVLEKRQVLGLATGEDKAGRTLALAFGSFGLGCGRPGGERSGVTFRRCGGEGVPGGNNEAR
jgi:hypothetical protein